MNKEKFCFDTLELKVHNLYNLVEQISQADSTILIKGESGTGKEALSHLIHEKSRRSQCNFLAINCSAIPENLIEAELFGYEAGSFTGATSAKAGKLETVGQGTLVLDEISGLDLKTQAKLLRVIEAKEFYRLGGQKPTKLEARIVATTNKDLIQLISKGLFREDLYYRLNVMKLNVPTLRERSKDIPLFVDFFLAELMRENSKTIEFSPEVYHFLCQQDWEGNIRELKNFVTRLFYLAKSDRLTVHDLIHENIGLEDSSPYFSVPGQDLSLDEIEKKYILHTMNLTQGNKSRAARTLKISLKTLRSKLKEYDYTSPVIAASQRQAKREAEHTKN